MVDCLVCANGDPDRFRIYYDGPIKLYRCLECGLVAQYPGPGRESRVLDYRDFYEISWDSAIQEWEYPERGAALADIARRIRAAGGRGRLLDVGCGDGQFIARCGELGLECAGVEESVALAEYARRTTGAEITTGRYVASMFAPATFDVISFIQVVEHLHEPRAVLEAASEHLRPGGIVCIEVPSRTAPHFLLYRATRIHQLVDYPRGVIPSHLAYYNPSAMRRLTSGVGLEEISLTTGRWAAKYHGWKHAIGRVVDPIANGTRVGGILYLGKRHR
jgi:2-polyprenyl-3-methyl-5-hydroxy-6-metoxy-1,4-benzoquinol methylase